MDNKKIGLFLKSLRTEKGLNQKGIAEVCNVSHQAVSKWEKGESLPDISSLKSLSEFYKISINEILDGEIDLNLHSDKSNNNFNKELIKLTMSLFVFFIAFLPFFNDGDRTFNGFEMIFEGEFGLGVIALITVISFILFQIAFSLFTMTRVISFSRGNVYLNRSLSVVAAIMVWFSITISALHPLPFVVYFIYLGSIYVVSTRVLIKLDQDKYYIERLPRYKPYTYILFYLIVLSIVPVYLIFFDPWFNTANMFAVPITVILYLSSISIYTYGFYNRKRNIQVSLYSKIISVHSMRLLYVFFFYLLYTEKYFLDISANSYDGVMYIVVYIAFELLVSNKHAQSMKQRDLV